MNVIKSAEFTYYYGERIVVVQQHGKATARSYWRVPNQQASEPMYTKCQHWLSVFDAMNTASRFDPAFEEAITGSRRPVVPVDLVKR